MHLIPIGYEEHLLCPLADPFGEDEWTDLAYFLSEMALDDEQYIGFVQLWDDDGDPPNGNGPWSLPSDQINAGQVEKLMQAGWQHARVAVMQVALEGDTPDDITRALVEQDAVFNYLTNKALVYIYPALHPEDCDCPEHQH